MVPGVYGRDLPKASGAVYPQMAGLILVQSKGCVFHASSLTSYNLFPRVCYKTDLCLEEKMEARDGCFFCLFLLFTYKCNKKASFLLLIALCYRVLNSDKPFEWTKENRNWLGMIGISPLVSFYSIH